MKLLGNLIWLLLGGIELALAYAIAGILSFLFIVTIPFGFAAFRLAGYTLWPFGRVIVRKPTAGIGSALGNIVWFVISGLWLAIGHVVAALLNAVTIIGIPFAVVHMKLAATAVRPLGREVVSKEAAAAMGPAEVAVETPR